ncbi:hypothetical protein NKR23_g347 [Pleurostoma richardsiae]|uniref:Uncharacterized protein n=1 Tax=Pleurostoma richardsiae TaxID=41990 RepID=A0AA38SCU4_9PEZI|nr:hypothetical protein NKR23_g347 [Pleurostoma richardsiae]
MGPENIVPYVNNVFVDNVSEDDHLMADYNDGDYCRLATCHLSLEKFPDLFDDEDEDELPPMIKITTPDGETFYPTDFKNYSHRGDCAPLWDGVSLSDMVACRIEQMSEKEYVPSVPYINNIFMADIPDEERLIADYDDGTCGQLATCHWSLESFSDVFDDEDEEQDELPPMITVTTPEGETYYPIDYRDYSRRNDRMPLWEGYTLAEMIDYAVSQMEEETETIPYTNNIFVKDVPPDHHLVADDGWSGRLSACDWRLERFPVMFDDEVWAEEDIDNPPPTLTLTTPEGAVYYPTDYKSYGGREDNIPLWEGYTLEEMVDYRITHLDFKAEFYYDDEYDYDEDLMEHTHSQYDSDESAAESCYDQDEESEGEY